jgi:NAD(P)-dependent dehydrogenase (short-subunit alcohol dehydrogenase family)
MKADLKGKVALLTGAGGGIGRATAEKLAKLGMKLALLGGNDREKLEATRKRAERYSAAVAIPGNLTDLDFLAFGVERVAEAFGGIDVLVNNAGTAQNAGIETITPAEFDRIMAINIRVPFFLTQKVLPYLKRSDAATVINIASVVAHAGYPMQSVYSASKHAILGFTKSLAREYYKEGIRVHAISPGGVYTDMVKVSRPDLTPDGMIMPEEIADLVCFFLENRGNAVVDEIIVHRLAKEPFLV